MSDDRKPMLKAYLPPTFRLGDTRLAGQVPTKRRMRTLGQVQALSMMGARSSQGAANLSLGRLAGQPVSMPGADMPRGLTEDRLLDLGDSPVLRPANVVTDLGMNVQEAAQWTRFLSKAVLQAGNEVVFRKAVMEKLLESGLDGMVRKAIFARAMSHWRTVQKSAPQFVEVEHPDGTVQKALYIGPRGGRWADAKHTIPFDPKKHGKGRKIFVIDKTKAKPTPTPDNKQRQADAAKQDRKKKVIVIDKTGEEKPEGGTSESQAIQKVPTEAERQETRTTPKPAGQLGLFEIPADKPKVEREPIKHGLTPESLLEYLGGRKPGTVITAGELAQAFPGGAPKHAKMLKQMVAAGQLAAVAPPTDIDLGSFGKVTYETKIAQYRIPGPEPARTREYMEALAREGSKIDEPSDPGWERMPDSESKTPAESSEREVAKQFAIQAAKNAEALGDLGMQPSDKALREEFANKTPAEIEAQATGKPKPPAHDEPFVDDSVVVGRVKIKSANLWDEFQALEVDTLGPTSSPERHALVAALEAGEKGWITLTELARDGMLSALGNMIDILEDRTSEGGSEGLRYWGLLRSAQALQKKTQALDVEAARIKNMSDRAAAREKFAAKLDEEERKPEVTEKKTAKPQGQVQQAVMDSLAALTNQGALVLVSNLTKQPAYRGIHYKRVQSAIDALEKKGLIETGSSDEGLWIRTPSEAGWERMPEPTVEELKARAAETRAIEIVKEEMDQDRGAGKFDEWTDEQIEAERQRRVRSFLGQPEPEPAPEKFELTEAKARAKPQKKAGGGRVVAVEAGEHVWGSRADLAERNALKLRELSPDEQAKFVTRANLLPTKTPEELLAQGCSPETVLLRKALEASVQTKANNTLEERELFMEGADYLARSLDKCNEVTDVIDFLEEWMMASSDYAQVAALDPVEMEQVVLDYMKARGLSGDGGLDKIAEYKQLAEEQTTLRHRIQVARTERPKEGPEREEADRQIQEMIQEHNSIGVKKSRLAVPKDYAVLKWYAESKGLSYATHTTRSDGTMLIFKRDAGGEKVEVPYTHGMKKVTRYQGMLEALGPRIQKLVETNGGKWSSGRRGDKPPKAWLDALLAAKDMRGKPFEEREQLMFQHLEGKKRTAGTSGLYRWERKVPGEIRRTGGVPVEQGDSLSVAQDFDIPNIQFGKEGWISDRDAEAHLKGLHGALFDLADVLGVDPKVMGLKKRLAFSIGARGGGFLTGNAHYEKEKQIINLTKMSGGGSVAHEWGHALDNILAKVHDPESTEADRFMSEGSTKGLPAEAVTAVEEVMELIRFKGTKAEREQARANERRLIELQRIPNAQRSKWEKREVKKLKESLQKAGMSDFYLDAMALNVDEVGAGRGGYWSRTREMFARAFEAFVEDQLKADGRESSYLVTGTDDLYPSLRWRSDEQFKKGMAGMAQPYPQGEERQKLNQAFRNLVDLLRDTGALLKALVFGGERFTIPTDDVLQKAKYKRRWKGSDGRWRYEYDEPEGKKRTRRAPAPRGPWEPREVRGQWAVVNTETGEEKLMPTGVAWNPSAKAKQVAKKLNTKAQHQAKQSSAGLRLADDLGIPDNARSGSLEGVINLVHEQAARVGNLKAEQTAYGIAYARQTGRVSGTVEMALRKLQGQAAYDLVADVMANTKTIGEVAGYLNRKFGGVAKSRITLHAADDLAKAEGLRVVAWDEAAPGPDRTVVQVVTVDDLLKADPKGGRYYKRVPTQKAGAKKKWRYFYDKKDYEGRDDRHVSGEEAASAHLSASVLKCVKGAGGSCGPESLAALVKRHGAKAVGKTLRQSVEGGTLSFKKGKFTLVKPGSEKDEADPEKRRTGERRRAGGKPARKSRSQG